MQLFSKVVKSGLQLATGRAKENLLGLLKEFLKQRTSSA